MCSIIDRPWKARGRSTDLGAHAPYARLPVIDWRRANWLVCLLGIADAHLWPFDVDGRWLLTYQDPARGMFAVLPKCGLRGVTQDEAMWIADCIGFDHDAPVGLLPTRWNRRPNRLPEPISPTGGLLSSTWYYEDLGNAYGAAANIRFGESYVLRYDGERGSPRTNFPDRFEGRENLVALYAMASRQADLLSEFLCLYRVVEAADGRNGLTFLTRHIRDLASFDFGTLRVIRPGSPRGWVNGFTVYRRRARQLLRHLAASGIASDEQVARYLYRLRNALAHGKHGTLVSDYGSQLAEVAAALPILKLVARIAVEP
jgi:hypothetical protein